MVTTVNCDKALCQHNDHLICTLPEIELQESQDKPPSYSSHYFIVCADWESKNKEQ